MKNMKTFEGFFKSLFGSEEESIDRLLDREDPRSIRRGEKGLSYEEVSDRILASFDEPKAIDHYFGMLRDMGKEKEFLSSEKGRKFADLRNSMRRR